METELKTDPNVGYQHHSNTDEYISSTEIITDLNHEDFSSQELQEIISHKPNWIVRKGVAIIGLVLLCLLGIASFIHYPKHITATMRIVSVNAPKKIIAPCEGRLQKLLVTNGSMVKKNQTIAFIQSNERHTGTSEINNIIISPEDGIIQYEEPLQEGQYLSASQNLFYIEPSKNSFYGKLNIKQVELNKIKEGQSVIIKLEEYPSSKYGYLLGKISFISHVFNNDSNCAVNVSLPQDRKTSYNKIVSYKNNLTAQAEIITGEHKLLEQVVAFGNPLAE